MNGDKEENLICDKLKRWFIIAKHKLSGIMIVMVIGISIGIYLANYYHESRMDEITKLTGVMAYKGQVFDVKKKP